jgi:hypothetical protein
MSGAQTTPRVLPEKLWRCDCGGETLGVSFYTWGDGTDDWFIEVYKMPARYSWSWRWRNALNLLVGREVVVDAVSLDRFKAGELVEFLQASIFEASQEARDEHLR